MLCNYDEIIQNLLKNINELKLETTDMKQNMIKLKLENTAMKQDIIELKNVRGQEIPIGGVIAYPNQYIDKYKIPIKINDKQFYFDNTETVLDLQYVYTNWKSNPVDIWIQLNKFNYLETIILPFFSGINLYTNNDDFSYFLLNKELIINYNNSFDSNNANINMSYIIQKIRELNLALSSSMNPSKSILEKMIRLKKIKLINITAFDPNIKSLLEDLQKYCDSRSIDLIIS
jgi:hypothetical protein